MTDKRAYFKLDVGYLTNPKVADVAVESATAVLLHIGSIGYAAQHLTDGEVPVSLLLRLTGATKDDAELLFTAGLWERAADGKAIVHDYLSHQRSSVEVKGASEVAKRAAQARWDADRIADSNADSNAVGMPDAMRSASPTPMPREKREKRETSKDLSAAADVDEGFAAWYAAYPRKEAKGSAVKAYRAARKKADGQTLLAAIQAHAPRMRSGDPKFIPLPATWLNQERWLDEARDPQLAVVVDPSQLPPRETSWMERRR